MNDEKPKLPTASEIALSVKCPECGAVANEDCASLKDPMRRLTWPHGARYKLAFAGKQQ